MSQMRDEPYQPADMSGWSDTEIRSKMIWDLEHMRMGEDDMIEHLWYCVDHEVCEARDRIIEIARSRHRKWRVRQVAVEYACRMLPLEEIYEKVLPTLAGRQMIDVVERFHKTESQMLIDFVWEYGERYGDQKMPCDALAIEMQDKRGLASFRNHLEKRGAVMRTIVYPDPIRMIAGIYKVELMDELERLLRLVLKDSFHDRKQDGLRKNLELAFQNVAGNGGNGAQEKVRTLLKDYRSKYPDESWKAKMLTEWLEKYEEYEENATTEDGAALKSM